MPRTAWLVVLVWVVFASSSGCAELFGRKKVIPDRGPLQGNTEVSIYVPGCGDHTQVKDVLFDTVKQTIVSQKDDEVKIRTVSVGAEKTAKVTLILPNQVRCETGAVFHYVKMETGTLESMFERGFVLGQRRPGGYRPDLAEEE